MELPSYFKRYLHAIQPTDYNQAAAIQRQSTLRERLKSEVKDPTFKAWFDDTFLYGSYARNTAIQPIKDVDICVLLNLNTSQVSPENVVLRLRKVLEGLGYEDKTALQHRSIRVEMSGMTMDVVPVVAINGKDQPLLIPNRKLEMWMTTHPIGHMKAATKLNAEHNKRYIPLVKIVKAWYRYHACELQGQVRPKPKGFTLEALVAQYQDPDAPSFAEGLYLFFHNVFSACDAYLKNDIFPPVTDPGMPEKQLLLSSKKGAASRFRAMLESSLHLAEEALQSETIMESASLWRALLGQKFPLPAAAKSLSELATNTTEDGDGDLEPEINEVMLPTPQYGHISKLKIRAEFALAKSASKIQCEYPSGGTPVDKNKWLKFSIAHTTVKPPYEIHWIVHNYGKEAAKANGLHHENCTTWSEPHHWESTLYRGNHEMIVQLRRNGQLLAEAIHQVRIK